MLFADFLDKLEGDIYSTFLYRHYVRQEQGAATLDQ